MRILVTGGTGVVGRRLVPLLVEKGHHVSATTTRAAGSEALRALGAEALVLDLLDGAAVDRTVRATRPDVVVHQATALKGLGSNMRRFESEFAMTNRLRTEGTGHLLAAAGRAGTGRFVAQGFAGWPYERSGGPVKTEEDPFDPDPPAAFRTTLEALRRMEAMLLETSALDALALRYGWFYGPGTSLGMGGTHVESVRRRAFPLIGSGAGVWSFAHVEDAASATAAACETGSPGVYNVCDDAPAPVSTWLPALAEAVGAKPPRHVPAWLGRVAAGEGAVSMMTQIRGASNAKAKRELDWTPSWPSWRTGFRDGLDERRGDGVR